MNVLKKRSVICYCARKNDKATFLQIWRFLKHTVSLCFHAWWEYELKTISQACLNCTMAGGDTLLPNFQVWICWPTDEFRYALIFRQGKSYFSFNPNKHPTLTYFFISSWDLLISLKWRANWKGIYTKDIRAEEEWFTDIIT